jgi:RNA-directed DNA polymerase
MQTALKNEIKKVAERAFARKAVDAKKVIEYRKRFRKRTNVEPGIDLPEPQNFVHPHFDPKYCKRNANLLAKVIWHKVQAAEYKPLPALNFFIDKPNGGKRMLMAFSIPDTALANIMMKRLRERNIKRFSPHSFAYHPDKNVFDAILDLRSFIRSSEKIYSVQVDFKNYFDSIPHTYLEKLLNAPELFSLTPAEKNVLKQFLHHEYAQKQEYESGRFEKRKKGTPQGSSISLILANLANHSLDTALEKLPGKFVRFADDVTALCESYEDAIKIERTFFDHCGRSGIELNKEKSPGIAVLANKDAEIRTVRHIDYLGYRFTESGLVLSEKKIASIKTKISKLISLYLTYYIRKSGFNKSRVSRKEGFDWDLLGLVSEIRNYLYGGLFESEIKSMLSGKRKLRRVRGLMSFYALLDDKSALQELDGWLAGTVARAMRKRAEILKQSYGTEGLTPNARSLIVGDWLNLEKWQDEPKPETALPSFVRGWRAARKFYLTYGLTDIEPPSYGYQY